MRRLRSKWWWTAAVVVLVAGAGLGVWLLVKPGGSSGTTASASTATVSAETIKETVSATGTVAPLHADDIDFGVSGTVTRVYVAEGDRVKKGQTLATVDPASLIAARTAAAAQLTAAEAQLSTDQENDASAVQIAADRAAIVVAQANHDAAVQAVQKATLTATISGTVTSVGIAKGDTVGSSVGSAGAGGSTGAGAGAPNAAASSSSSSAGFTIVSDSTWVVDATVASADVSKIKKGLQAQITVTGVADTVYGTVASVGLVAETSTSGAAVFPVTIAVTGKRDDLFSGTSATASIIVKQTEGVITVASRALKTEGDETYVTKVVDGKEVKQVVTIGDAYGASTVITQGLAEGDTVVVPGFTRPAGGGGRNDEMPMPDFSNMPGGFPGGEPPSDGFPGGFPGGGR